MPNSEIDLIGKIEVFLHHKLADVLSGYIWGGENTAGPNYATTALYLNGTKNAYSVYYKGSTPAALATSSLQDDNYYIFSTDFTQATVKIVANKVTIVNNALIIGSNINGSAQAKGTQELTTDLGILSGRNNTAYIVSSKHKIIWVKVYDKSGVLMHEFNFSEGAGEQTFDVVTGNAYPISNITPASFWNYTNDFNHYNFRYGFTLYQKSGSADIRIPNKKDGTEIVPSAVPSGYTRIANYKECRQVFNQCENVFVLDNVALIAEHMQITGAGTTAMNGSYYYDGELNGKPKYKNPVNNYIIYFLSYWRLCDQNATVLYYDSQFKDVMSPAGLIYVKTANGTNPAPTVSLVPASVPDLYIADTDHFLFAESTGVAKEIEIQNIDVDTGFDRGHLYINPNSQEKNLMLYKTDKTLLDDVKIIKYIGLGDEIVTDESGDVVYDENDHTVLED